MTDPTGDDYADLPPDTHIHEDLDWGEVMVPNSAGCHRVTSDSGDTRPDLDAIEARANAATEGPWFRDYGDVVLATDDPRDVMADEPRHARVVQRAAHRDLRDEQAIADATFIAHARTDVPALVAAVRDLTARIAAADALCESWGFPPANPATDAADSIVRSFRAALVGAVDTAEVRRLRAERDAARAALAEAEQRIKAVEKLCESPVNPEYASVTKAQILRTLAVPSQPEGER